MGKLEYNGVPEFSRKRKLTETNIELASTGQLEDLKPPVIDQRDQDTDGLFKRLAETYIKGEALRRGLSKMEPAQFIPIDQEANSVIAATSRLFKSESLEGKVITYSMYQKSVDYITDKKWEVRRTYFRPSNIISKESSTTKTSETINSGSKNFLKDFFDHNGIAGSILAMLVLSPFQNIIFQALGVEEGAKTTQSIQVPAGIALFIELGIKAERIAKIFKTANIGTPLVEQQIVRMENPDERAAALSEFGIDYGDLKKSMELTDHEAIINYVSEYYARYGGLAAPNSHLTIDHWIAYLQVSQNQHVLRGALNIADAYSEDFSNIREPNRLQDPIADANSLSSRNDKSKISIQLASATRAMRERSNDMYDNIINSLMYQVSDDAICCLVSIFGAFKDTDLMKTIASLLRLLAVDLGGEIVRLDNLARQFLSNFFASAIFELYSDVERLLEKILHKLVKLFTVDIPGLEKCVGLLTVGWAMMESVNLLFNHIKDLLKEIMSLIHAYGQPGSGSWTIAADRRHLLGIARILEVMAAKLDVASVCDNKIANPQAPITSIEAKDIVAGEVVHTILDGSPPSVQLTNQEIEKYFPNVKPQVSERLRFMFGIPGLQNLEGAANKNCSKPASKEEIDELSNSFASLLRQEFS